MADITSRPAIAPRFPLRAVGVALVIVALIAIAAFVHIGSHQQKLPAPFGPAANGLISYAQGGDIYTVDPLSGVTAAIVTGPEIDASPEFSLDGSKLAFIRRHDVGAQSAFDLVVARADGSEPRVISTEPLDLTAVTSWTADSTGLLVGGDGTVTRYDAIGTARPQVVIPSARYVAGEIRPPDGAQVVFENDETPEVDLWIADIDGSKARTLVPATAINGKEGDLAEVRWSPDGALVAFTCTPPDGSDGLRICLMNADGSNIHVLTDESGIWVESDLKWAPDGRSIAINRWQYDPETAQWPILPIGIVDVATGHVRDVGPAPASEGALFDFSPDGSTILSLPARYAGSADPNAMPSRPLVIDVASGNAQDADWSVASDVSWQRTAD